jgi:hypothetical protein
LLFLDPEAPPTFILESRCRNVRVHVIPLSDTTCHHCEAVVKFVTSGLHRFYAVVCTDKKFQKELVFQFQFTARYALNDIFN